VKKLLKNLRNFILNKGGSRYDGMDWRWCFSSVFLVAVIMLFTWLETVFPGLRSIPKGIYLGMQLIIVGILCYLFDLLLKREKPRIVIDKATGKEIVLKGKHTMFFIPVFWWSVIISLGGLYCIVASFFGKK
jgi:hypothetical protein